MDIVQLAALLHGIALLLGAIVAGLVKVLPLVSDSACARYVRMAKANRQRD